MCLPLDQKFAALDLAEDDEFLKAIKFLSTHSFRGEIKPLATCRKIFRHVEDPCGV